MHLQLVYPTDACVKHQCLYDELNLKGRLFFFLDSHFFWSKSRKHACVCISWKCASTGKRKTHIHTRAYTCTHTQTYAHTYTHVHTHTYASMCKHICIRIFIYIHIHIYTPSAEWCLHSSISGKLVKFLQSQLYNCITL